MGAFKHHKAVVFQSVFVPMLTYGHQSWAMTERMLTQAEAPKMKFLHSPGVFRGCMAPGARNKFGATMFGPKVFLGVNVLY